MSLTPQSSDGAPDPRVVLAAERTLLAWVRTGLALMGLGFVIARFGLFLREMADVQGAAPPATRGVSQWFGVLTIILAVLMLLLAAVQHYSLVRRLGRGEPAPVRPASMGIILAALLAVLGLGLAGYLLWLQ